MFATKRLLCAAAIVFSFSAAAAFAQTPVAPPPAGTSPADMNRVTPSPSVGGPAPDAATTDRRPASEQSPLLNSDTSWTPRSPRLPNASPDEPSLNAPLLPFER